MNIRLDFLRERAKQLPLDPGVYIMKDSAGKIIYIGKAKALRNRVSSYFRSIEKHTEKVFRMVENAYDFSTIVTASEFEALVLECSLIKQHKPKYNILLKDDKGYHYIHVSAGDYPRITAEKMNSPNGGRYLGPYTSSFVVKQTVEEANRAFTLPTCKRKFPEDFRKARPCLNFHIKRCMGTCTGRINKKQYAEIINQAMEFMSGGSNATLKIIAEHMQEASENLEFEKAAMLRDRIKTIERINDEQNVVFTNAINQDVISIVQNSEQSCAVVIKFRGQRLVDKLEFMLGQIDTLEGARRDFLLSFYGAGAEVPKIIALDGECDDNELLQQYLSKQKGEKVAIVIPERGEGLRLVQMASSNAAQQLAHKLERTGKEISALDELARLLGLAQPPVYIESYDISNYGSETMVAGMVVFQNGRPLKSAYKKFNIKTVDGTDDYASMREVIARRFSRYFEEKESGEGFGKLPDLILLDGGKGHVSAITPIIEDLGLEIPIFGMVKDKKHRTRAIAKNGGEISITSSRSAFTLVSKIQDEVHRFSITFMKQKHSKNSFTLALTAVDGIGEKRALSLLTHFKTQKALREADTKALAAAPNMTMPVALKLYEHLHSKPE